MGKPIAQHQLISATLANMETKCEAARLLVYKCGQMIDDGVDGSELTKISAMASLLHGLAMDVTSDASRSSAATATCRSTRSSG